MPLIRTTGTWPAGGWAFTDARTGYRFPGMDCTFYEQVNRIIQFRLSNPRVFDSTKPEDAKLIQVGFVKGELEIYTCDRLGNDKRFCIGKDQVENLKYREKYYAQVDPSVCPKCGQGLQPKYCETCGGQRQIGLKCVCGFEVLR